MKSQICNCGGGNFKNRPCTIYDKNVTKRNMRSLRLESKYSKTKNKENFYLYKNRNILWKNVKKRKKAIF